MFFLQIDQSTIVVAANEKQAIKFSKQQFGADEEWEEVEDDLIVGSSRNIDGYGYDGIYLYQVLEERKTPYVLKTEKYNFSTDDIGIPCEFSEAPLEIQKKMQEVFMEAVEEFNKIGIKCEIKKIASWDVIKEIFDERTVFDLEQFKLHLGENIAENVARTIQKIKEYEVFSIKILSASSGFYSVYYRLDDGVVLEFFMDSAKPIDIEIGAWEELFDAWGFEEKVEELKVERVFDSEKAEEKLHYILYQFNRKDRLHREEVANEIEKQIEVIRFRIENKVRKLQDKIIENEKG